MKVVYVFSSQGHTDSSKLGRTMLPQLEEGYHGAVIVCLLNLSLALACNMPDQLVTL